jgi:hypothetical protein
MGSCGRPLNAGRPAMAAATAMSCSVLGALDAPEAMRGVSGDEPSTRPMYWAMRLSCTAGGGTSCHALHKAK